VSGYGDQALAVIFYAINLILIGLFFLALWLYAVYRGRLVDPATPRGTIRHTTLRLSISLLVFLLSVPIALFNPTLAKFWWLMIPAINLTARQVGELD
jgi:hypothetical protein